MPLIENVDRIREVRRDIEVVRAGSRADVARELSIAITAIEDAEMRLVRAIVLNGRNRADAIPLIEAAALDEKLIDPAAGQDDEPTTTQEG